VGATVTAEQPERKYFASYITSCENESVERVLTVLEVTFGERIFIGEKSVNLNC